MDAKLVKELREKTGAGMMDCKKALVATDGNIEKAIEHLREKGLAATAKKAGRIAAEGVVESYIHMGGKIGVLVEINCETDLLQTDVLSLARVAPCNRCCQSKLCLQRRSTSGEVEHEKILLAQA